MLLIAPLLLGAQLVLVADTPPRLDVEPSCRAASRPGLNGDSPKVCMNEEKLAHDKLTEQWSSFPQRDRTRCANLVKMGGPPSYVELLTCLEMAQQARKLPPNSAADNIRPATRETTGSAPARD